MLKYILHTVPLLEETAQSITILEDQFISFSCIPTPDYIMLNWTMNGNIIVSSEQVTLTPESLHHVVTIRNAVIHNSGEYICYIVNFPILVNRTIRLNVLQGTCIKLHVID